LIVFIFFKFLFSVLSEKEMEELTGKGNVIDILAEDIIKAKTDRKEK